MGDVPVWLTVVGMAVSGLGGLVLSTLRIRNSIITRDEYEKDALKREKDCAQCGVTYVTRVELERLVGEAKHTIRNEVTPILTGQASRIQILEQHAAVAQERRDNEKARFDAIDEKLDRILDTMPQLVARVSALERAQS